MNVEGDVTLLEAGTGDSPNPWSDDNSNKLIVFQTKGNLINLIINKLF
jgi:hypothetical protein